MRPLLAVLVAVAAAFLSACTGGTQPPAAGSPGSVPAVTQAVAETARTPAPSPAPQKESPAVNTPSDVSPAAAQPGAATELATFGGGCFWCIEAVFEQLDGVTDVRSGFMGGTVARPTYREVCEGDTGAAEVVQVRFDPAKVSYDTLLAWFWKSHDPTSLDRQGADEGTQYRSVIFWHSPQQRDAAERSKAELGKLLEDPVVTEVSPAGSFTEAEAYHQDYYRQNGAQPYCRGVIQPKLKKLGLKY